MKNARRAAAAGHKTTQHRRRPPVRRTALRRIMFASRTLETVSQWIRNMRKYVLSMFLKVDNLGAERMCSGRLFQATGPATMPGCRVVALPWVRPNHHKQWRASIIFKLIDSVDMYTHRKGRMLPNYLVFVLVWAISRQRQFIMI